MTVEELRELIDQGEDSMTQLKRQFNGVDAVASEIAAMAKPCAVRKRFLPREDLYRTRYSLA